MNIPNAVPGPQSPHLNLRLYNNENNRSPPSYHPANVPDHRICDRPFIPGKFPTLNCTALGSLSDCIVHNSIHRESSTH